MYVLKKESECHLCFLIVCIPLRIGSVVQCADNMYGIFVLGFWFMLK